MSNQFQKLVELLLPEGLLNYFDLTAISRSKEGQVHLHLEERNDPPAEFKGRLLHSKGLLPAIEVQDWKPLPFNYYNPFLPFSQ